MALNIISNVQLDMKAPNTVIVYANQYDSAGSVRAQLLNSGESWSVPAGAKAVVMFKKSDNIGGFYDVTEFGVAAVEIDSDRSVVYINYDPQVLTTAGRVAVQINFYQNDQRLSSFAFYTDVQASAVTSGEIASSWLFNILSQEIAQTLTVATTPQAMTDWLEANITQETGYVIDNTLTVAGAASDAQATGKMVTVSNLNPNTVANKVWVKKTPATLEIPTMEDIDELNRQLSDVEDNQIPELKSAFDIYGADNRIPDKTGTFYPGSLTVVGNKNVFSISGSPTGSSQIHFDIYNNSSAFPAGISAGMSLQLVQVCSDSKIHYKFYEFVNGSQSMICDISGDGTAQININASATGCIIRISVDNGNTYSNVESSIYIFGTLTKQQIQGQIETNAQSINVVDAKITAMKAYMPTAGNQQYLNVDTAQIINARVSDSSSRLLADSNYRAIVVPVSVQSGKTYWAKIFADSVTLGEIKLYTFNSVDIGTSIAVDMSNLYNATSKQSRVQTTADALYFVLVLRLTSGTVEDALNGVVIALSNDAPVEYQPYYVSVDNAISNAVGKKTSSDCVEVGTSAEDYSYTNINTAVSQNAGSIIRINYGTYETEVEDLTTDKTLIGTNRDLCILEKHGGNYNQPPIEIAGGYVENLTVKMVNDTEASQFGYCVHSDNSATANKTLVISNCAFDNDLYRVIGMGVRGGETVIFENCVFIGHGNTAGQSIYIHNSSGTKATVKFRNCYFQAVNECLLLQAWGSDCSVDWEFINCTCYSENYGVGIETVWTDYVSGSTHDQNRLHEFSGKFALLPTSHGNNISVLNYSN